MKRLCSSSDSLGGLMSICQTSTGEHNQVYSREFQSMLEGLDEEGCVEESGYMPNEKKRRLSLNQVKALEKNFEVENKLEPDRKIKLAQELGLQPRQVAVWFQNRRVRWKTKQLERDYGILKANYDALKHNFEKLQHENQFLIQEIGELKSKLQNDKDESNVSIKEEEMAYEKEKSPVDDDEEEEETELNFQSFNSNNGLMGAKLFTDFKDGLSDSDSSAILNEENNNNNKNNNGFQFSDSKAAILGNDDTQKAYQPQFVKIEEHNFFGGDESCSTFFSDDQPPSLHWDCPEEWN